MEKEPWGHKLVLEIYVEGDEERLNDVTAVLENIPMKGIDFIGGRVEPVFDKPKQQEGS